MTRRSTKTELKVLRAYFKDTDVPVCIINRREVFNIGDRRMNRTYKVYIDPGGKIRRVNSKFAVISTDLQPQNWKFDLTEIPGDFISSVLQPKHKIEGGRLLII
jgi:hypothetical protein